MKHWRVNFEPQKIKIIYGIGIYRIRGIIGESNIWRFALKMQLARFLFGDFKYCMERNPYTYSLNGVHLIWRYIHDLPN